MRLIDTSVKRPESPLNAVMAPTGLDLAIAKVFPKWGAQRLKARREFSWEAARSTRLRSSASMLQGPEDYTVFPDRLQLMRQMRSIEQNMGLAQSIIDKLALYAFGQMRYRSFCANKTSKKKYEAYLAEKFRTIDITGRHNLRDLTCLAFKSQLRDGDYGEQWRQTPEGLKLAGIESDRIGGMSMASANDFYFQGITVDPDTGRPQNYLVYQRTKGNAYVNPVEIDARDFILYFDPRRVDQYRGITPFAPVINEMTDLKEVMEDCRIGTKFENRHAAIQYTESGQPLGDPDSYINGTELANGTTAISKQEIFPGLVQTVPTNGKIDFIKSERPSGNFQTYLDTLIRLIGMALNLPYGFLYKLSDLSGPSARMDAQQAHRVIKWHQDNMRERRLNRIVEMLMIEGFATGEIPFEADWRAGGWQFAPAISIDAGRDSQAMVNEWRCGLLSKDNIFGENGEDSEEEEMIIEEEADRQIKRAQRLAAENGITYEQAMNQLEVRVPNGLVAPQQVAQEPADPSEADTPNPTDAALSSRDRLRMDLGMLVATRKN